MAVQTDTIANPATQWRAAIQRLEAADRAYKKYDRDVYGPAAERARMFEERHGLISPCRGRAGTPGYYEKRKALSAIHHHTVPAPINDEIERLCDVYIEALDALMEMPAPHADALRWKLDRVLEIEHDGDEQGGSTPCWSAAYVRQTIADYRALLAS